MANNKYMTITLIHGKYYDLRDFKHAGGSIHLAEKRDDPELFESHHLLLLWQG